MINKEGKITTQELKEFREDFAKVVKDLEDKYGYKIRLGNITYNERSFNGKIEVVKNIEGDIDIDQFNFEKYCGFYGLSKEDYGKTFKSNNKEYKLVSINPKARSYPLIGIDENGTKYKFPSSIANKLS